MIARNKPVPIDCLDKPRSLLFGLNALAEVKQALGGKDVLSWSKEDWKSLFSEPLHGEPKRLTVLVAALLRHEDKTVTAEQVGDMVTSAPQIIEISHLIMRAWAHFAGRSDEEFDESMAKAGQDHAAAEPDDQDPTASARIPTDSGQLLATTSG